MARYIDADELIRLIGLDALCYKPYSKRDAIACVKTMPTADVVPRADFEALKDEADRYKRYFYRHDYDEMIAEAKAEVAREIFEEMDEIMLPLLHEVSQVYIYVKLKKKYTEPEPPEGD